MTDNTNTADEVDPGRNDSDGNNAKLEENLKSRSTWVRFLYMLLFSVFFCIATSVLSIVVLFQFLTALFTGEPNAKVLGLGRALSQYVSQILIYLTYNSEERPFPFADWPGADRD